MGACTAWLHKYSLGSIPNKVDHRCHILLNNQGLITDISKNKYDQTDLTSTTMSTVIITSVPDCVSPEEHRSIVASTPSSFSNIPPVLRHKEENVSAILDPPLDEFTPDDGTNGVLYVIERYAERYPVYTPRFTSHPVRSCSCRPLAVDSRSSTPRSPFTQYHAEAAHLFTVSWMRQTVALHPMRHPRSRQRCEN